MTGPAPRGPVAEALQRIAGDEALVRPAGAAYPLGYQVLAPGQPDARASAIRSLVAAGAALPAGGKVAVVASHDLAARAVLDAARDPAFGDGTACAGKSIGLSFSNPNLNKPLHLGHLRNIVIGDAFANLLVAQGASVERGIVLSDWGIHICQALVGHRHFGSAVPDRKSDHYVGAMYARYHAAVGGGAVALEHEAAEVLRVLTAGDAELAAELERLTGWADAGMDATYDRLGVRFEVKFSERASLPTARRLVEDAVASGHCQRRADGSVYYDLSDIKLGEQTLLRQDGTTLVLTQWMGVYVDRHRPGHLDTEIIVTGMQWADGSRAMGEMLRRIGYSWDFERVLYGMVSTPEGRLRSREGAATVDALLDDVREDLAAAAADADVSADDVESLAIALVKVAFLSVPRDRDVVFDQSALVAAAATLRDVLAGLAVRDAPDPTPDARLLAALDNLPYVVYEAERRRAPDRVLRYGAALGQTLAAARGGPADVARVGRQVIRRCCALLNVPLPADVAGGVRALERMTAPQLLARR